MTSVKSFEKEAGIRSWIARNANRGLGDIARNSGGEIAARGKGVLAAVKGTTAERVGQVANELMSAQKKKHLMIGAGAATGLAGLTYLKGRQDMKKQASWFKPTLAEKAAKGFKNKYKTIEKALKALPDDTKKHLLKKVKVKRGHLYAAGAAALAGGAGAGFAASHFGEK